MTRPSRRPGSRAAGRRTLAVPAGCWLPVLAAHWSWPSCCSAYLRRLRVGGGRHPPRHDGRRCRHRWHDRRRGRPRRSTPSWLTRRRDDRRSTWKEPSARSSAAAARPGVRRRRDGGLRSCAERPRPQALVEPARRAGDRACGRRSTRAVSTGRCARWPGASTTRCVSRESSTTGCLRSSSSPASGTELDREARTSAIVDGYLTRDARHRAAGRAGRAVRLRRRGRGRRRDRRGRGRRPTR